MTTISLAERKRLEAFVKKMLRDSVRGLSPPIRFTEVEVFRLLRLFREMCSPETMMNKGIFRVQLHRSFMLLEDMMLNRIFLAFDRDNDGLIDSEEYIWGMSAFLKGTQEDRIRFCFRVYDPNNDGIVTRHEMLSLLKDSLTKVAFEAGEDDPEETTREMVEIVYKKLDKNFDGKVDFADYKKSVEADPLLMECLGQCLPVDEDVDKFMDSLPQPY